MLQGNAGFWRETRTQHIILEKIFLKQECLTRATWWTSWAHETLRTRHSSARVPLWEEQPLCPSQSCWACDPKELTTTSKVSFLHYCLLSRLFFLEFWDSPKSSDNKIFKGTEISTLHINLMPGMPFLDNVNSRHLKNYLPSCPELSTLLIQCIGIFFKGQYFKTNDFTIYNMKLWFPLKASSYQCISHWIAWKWCEALKFYMALMQRKNAA